MLPRPYSFSHSALALTWLAPTIGAIIGALWGDWFNSWLQARYIRSHAGVYVLENRLWGTYAPTLVSFTGLILFGQTLEHSMHWIGLLIGWGFWLLLWFRLRLRCRLTVLTAFRTTLRLLRRLSTCGGR